MGRSHFSDWVNASENGIIITDEVCQQLQVAMLVTLTLCGFV